MKKMFSIFIFFICFHLTAAKYDYKLSVCMIFQNDAPYLKEWIEFHRLLGVEHFYLYNNLSTDNYKAVLDPYVKINVVELMEWPFRANNVQEWDKIQIDAYNDALKKAKKKSKWLANLDSDEFLFPTASNDLRKFFSNYEKISGVGGVCVNWVVYGTSGVDKIPDNKLLIETLVYSSAAGSDHYKSVFRPKRVSHVCSPHYVIYKKGYVHCTPSNKPVNGPFIEINDVRINHYWSRDEWYLNNVKIPRRLIWGTGKDTCKVWSEASNGTYDTSIFRFIEPLRKRM